MVSCQLSGRPFFPRPPVVCIGGPKSGLVTVYLMLMLTPPTVEVYQQATLMIDAYNPAFRVGSRYSVAWNPGDGIIDPYPLPWNGRRMFGTWHAPGHETTTWITVLVTWPDGQSAFKALSVRVYSL